MPVNNTTVLCGKCKVALKEDSHIRPDECVPCPSCGSTARIFEVTIHDGIVMKSKLGMKARHSSGKKPFIEQVTGDDFHRKTAKWMNVSRVYDREHDLYKEIITDPVTREVIHECIEPLSEHTGHGSAKHKKKTID